MKYLVQLTAAIPGRREARNALHRTVAELEFATADSAIAYLAAPWNVAAHRGRAIAFDDRSVNDGGGVTVLAMRENGKPLNVKG